MRTILFLLTLHVVLLCTAAMADDSRSSAGDSAYSSSHGQAPGTMGTTTAQSEAGPTNLIRDEYLGIVPQAGVMLYNNGQGTSTEARAIEGLTIDLNLSRFISPEMARDVYAGLSTGILYSHLGSPDGNFFGQNSPTQVTEGANFFYVPIDVKLGYVLTDNFRVAAHGGVNVVYRSNATAMFVSDQDPLNGFNSQTTMFPNVGADIDFSIAKNILLSVRPDVTLGTGDRLFSGTVGLAFGLS